MALEKAKFINNNDNNIITVQFNPSSLSIVANAMVSQKKTQQLNSDSFVINVGGIQSRQLSVSLVFDAYSEEGNIVSSFLGMGKKNKDIKTVIDNFESFMDSLAEISFVWGKIIFSGYIKNISSKYEMFDSQGRLMRATVDILMEESAYQGQLFQDVELNIDEDEDGSEEGMLAKIISKLSGS